MGSACWEEIPSVIVLFFSSVRASHPLFWLCYGFGMVANVPESLEVQPAVLSFLLAPVYHIHCVLVVFSEGGVHVFASLISQQSLHILVLYIIAVDSQKAGGAFL